MLSHGNEKTNEVQQGQEQKQTNKNRQKNEFKHSKRVMSKTNGGFPKESLTNTEKNKF